MLKQIVVGFLFLIFSIGLSFADERLFVTTYYPSPAGVYNELQSNKISVGDTDGDGALTSADLPNRDGDLRLKPQPNDPAGWPAGALGQFSYSTVNDSFYHYNGSTWVAQSGGGCYVSHKNMVANPCNAASCISGFTLKGEAGYGEVATFVPGGSSYVSRGCVCCQ